MRRSFYCLYFAVILVTNSVRLSVAPRHYRRNRNSARLSIATRQSRRIRGPLLTQNELHDFITAQMPGGLVSKQTHRVLLDFLAGRGVKALVFTVEGFLEPRLTPDFRQFTKLATIKGLLLYIVVVKERKYSKSALDEQNELFVGTEMKNADKNIETMTSFICCRNAGGGEYSRAGRPCC